MAATQLNFTLRTSANCKTVDLFGSWDNYSGQLPLTKDTKNSGEWFGLFKFESAPFKQDQRYWYYYIIDGCHVLHDPVKNFTTEPTTGRKLNILDIFGETTVSFSAPSEERSSHSSSRNSRRVSTSSIPKGRSLSPSKIVAPKPERPYQAQRVIDTPYDNFTLEVLT